MVLNLLGGLLVSSFAEETFSPVNNSPVRGGFVAGTGFVFGPARAKIKYQLTLIGLLKRKPNIRFFRCYVFR